MYETMFLNVFRFYLARLGIVTKIIEDVTFQDTTMKVTDDNSTIFSLQYLAQIILIESIDDRMESGESIKIDSFYVK